MARSQTAMVLINNAMGGVNAIFGGGGEVCEVGVGRRGKGYLSYHGWMSHGGQERDPQNDC